MTVVSVPGVTFVVSVVRITVSVVTMVTGEMTIVSSITIPFIAVTGYGGSHECDKDEDENDGFVHFD